MAEAIELKAWARGRSGKGGARTERREGRVPGTLYGDKQEPQTISVDYRAVNQQLHTGHFQSTIYVLDVEGKKTRVIPRAVQRSVDERWEERTGTAGGTAVLAFRGRRHVVRLINTSPSGAMVIFAPVPHIGEQVALQLLDRGLLSATVRWVRDGRIGVSFESAAN